MSEMANGMAMSPRSKDTLSYLRSRESGDDSPESMPEIARELTMVLGSIDGLVRGVSRVEEEVTILRGDLRHLRPEREDPGLASVSDFGRAARTSLPVCTPLGADLNGVWDSISHTTERLEQLAVRLSDIRRELAL